jgi:serine O-acetyltransferase
MKKVSIDLNTCVTEEEIISQLYAEVPKVVGKLVKSWNKTDRFEHIGPIPIPSHESVVQIIHQTRCILFPGYFSKSNPSRENFEYYIGQKTTCLYEELARQVTLALKHDCFRKKQPCFNCKTTGHEMALKFIQALPSIGSLLTKDITAALEGDPAAQGPDEVIFSYPGLLAITIYRMANTLMRLGVPIIPRIMTEHAHSLTGIDIHPGAAIGEHFFIDHGTGVVIGETTEIGNRVRLYQGVTLGALSLPRNAGTLYRGTKRHPTIEDDVIIYANTTILGGETIIGARSVIGGNIWITESVAPDTKVLLKRPELKYLGRA